jgi:hypothetical protein
MTQYAPDVVGGPIAAPVSHGPTAPRGRGESVAPSSGPTRETSSPNSPARPLQARSISACTGCFWPIPGATMRSCTPSSGAYTGHVTPPQRQATLHHRSDDGFRNNPAAQPGMGRTSCIRQSPTRPRNQGPAPAPGVSSPHRFPEGRSPRHGANCGPLK